MTEQSDPSLPVLGETSGTLNLEDRARIRDVALSLARQAKRELRIFSQDLDAPLYDQVDFLKAVKDLALRAPHLPIRILLVDAEPAVRNGHRLVELARRFTSAMQIRSVAEDFAQSTVSYLIADDRGYLMRRLADVYEGTADFDAPPTVRRLRKEFERIWEVGDIHQELRRLSL